MVRHIFIATIKDGVSEEIVNQKMEEMRAMKDSVLEIESIMVGRSLGWVGAANTDVYKRQEYNQSRPAFACHPANAVTAAHAAGGRTGSKAVPKEQP